MQTDPVLGRVLDGRDDRPAGPWPRRRRSRQRRQPDPPAPPCCGRPWKRSGVLATGSSSGRRSTAAIRSSASNVASPDCSPTFPGAPPRCSPRSLEAAARPRHAGRVPRPVVRCRRRAEPRLASRGVAGPLTRRLDPPPAPKLPRRATSSPMTRDRLAALALVLVGRRAVVGDGRRAGRQRPAVLCLRRPSGGGQPSGGAARLRPGRPKRPADPPRRRGPAAPRLHRPGSHAIGRHLPLYLGRAGRERGLQTRTPTCPPTPCSRRCATPRNTGSSTSATMP